MCRFDIDDDPFAPVKPTCSVCDRFIQCDIDGHRSVGWCQEWEVFASLDDETCEDYKEP